MFTELKLPNIEAKLLRFVEQNRDPIQYPIYCSVGISGGGFVYRVIHCEDQTDFINLENFLLRNNARKIDDLSGRFRCIFLVD
ncbi:hypothetical protein OF381_10375 [Mannheimia haemolytica]